MRRGRKPKFWMDGVLAVNKPAGPTSHDVVARFRRRFAPAKLGHAGTLDPFSTGILVLVFNQATRLSEILGTGDKVYRARLALGQATDTCDLTGQVVEEAPVPEISRERAEAALMAMVGERLQSPPAYSAAKHQGRPLYAYAREGVAIEKPPKPITVYEAELIELAADWLDFRMRCSRGTYLRSLGVELAQDLGTVGHLTALAREESAPFTLKEAVDFDTALSWEAEDLAAALTSPSQALSRCGVPTVCLDEDLVWDLRQGRFLDREVFLKNGPPEARPKGIFQVLAPDGGLAAILRWLGPGEARPGRDYETIRVFPETASGKAGEPAVSRACEAE